MASSEMLRLMALVRTDVSEELSASIIIVTSFGELRTLTVTSNRPTLGRNTTLLTLMMDGPSSAGPFYPRNVF
jgi:hypothetical protein